VLRCCVVAFVVVARMCVLGYEPRIHEENVFFSDGLGWTGLSLLLRWSLAHACAIVPACDGALVSDEYTLVCLRSITYFPVYLSMSVESCCSHLRCRSTLRRASSSGRRS
jgi:hypothetical protein